MDKTRRGFDREAQAPNTQLCTQAPMGVSPAPLREHHYTYKRALPLQMMTQLRGITPQQKYIFSPDGQANESSTKAVLDDDT